MNIDTQALVTLSAAGAGTYTSPDLQNAEWRGISVGINLTAMTSATVTVTVNGKDAASGTYYPLLSSTALASAGFTALQVYPGLTNTANSRADAVLPKTYQISVVVTGTSATGTVGGSLIQ